MQLETQRIRDQALALAKPIGKAALVAGKSARSGFDQAIDASHDLPAQLNRLIGRAERDSHDAIIAARKSARSGLDQAMDVSHDLQLQLKRLMGRPERDSRKIVFVAGAVIVLAGVGAAVLASGPVRRAVRGQVDRIRARLRSREAMAADQAARDHEEDLLDDRLDASFPASDPVGANHFN